MSDQANNLTNDLTSEEHAEPLHNGAVPEISEAMPLQVSEATLEEHAETPRSVRQENLIEVPHDWEREWRGLPDYSHKDLMPHKSLLVHFRSEEDRQAFAKLIGQRLQDKTKFVWHPKAEIRRASDKLYRSAQVTPRYPI